MRRLVIKSPTGMFLEGISNYRNYYFFELDDMAKKAENVKGTIERQIVCIFDGERIVDDNFNITDNLQSNVEIQMKKNNAESVKHLNQLQKEIDLNRPFKEFLIKYDEKLSQDDTEPFPFLLDIRKLKKMCDVIYKETGKHFYLELNNTIRLINNLYIYLVQEAELNKVGFYEFVEKEENFSKICEYIPTKMASIDASRIENIYPSLTEYRALQKTLFKELPFYLPFNDCMNMQYELVNDIYNEYHKRMFESNSIENIETLEEEIILPVLKEYHAIVLKTLNSFERAGV